ncbi:MAG TPA: intein-containing recombinase RecA [Candidatus Limnocylindrales bacterium]|nr:intein-containing recombinase RecA [Candidatus Limnocylindrales bacterium]
MAATTNPDKSKALDLALAQIDKQFGKGSVMRLGERPVLQMQVIPTGSIALDVALGVGGLPRGRIVEIYGPEASGKTSLALHAIANAQRNGGICAIIDAEHALDPEYAKALGVDTDALLVSQPDTGEQALEIADMLVRSGALDLIVIDSVAALVPRAEIEGEMGDSHVGLQARLMSQALRKITGALNNSNTTAIFINQLREKIGVMFGSPETTTGGKALKFYASIRLDVRRIESLKDGTEIVGNRTRVKVVKNKCLAAGSMVFDPTTGLTHRIEDVVDGRLPVSVVAAAKDGTLHIRPVTAWLDQGEQEVVGIQLRGGTTLWATHDHKVMTDQGWKLAGDLAQGDRVAQPREFLGFGDEHPYSPDHARLLGYLIGDGYVGGKTPMTFINVQESLKDDASRIAAELGCDPKRQDGKLSVAFSHRIGEKNGVLELCRRAGIYGKLAWEKTIPAEFFDPGTSREVIANLLFGLFETDGWVSSEQTGAIRVGYATTSEQLASQIHWLLLRFGIASSVRRYDPTGQRPSIIKGRPVVSKRICWEVRVAGNDNVEAYAEALPMWGPRSQALLQALSTQDGRRRGSQAVYLATDLQGAVLAHLAQRDISPTLAAQLIGPTAGDPKGGMKQVLGLHRIRRDRLQLLATALEDQFLLGLLSDQLRYASVKAVLPARRDRTFDIEVDELHTFVADDVVVHNCSAPFKQAEFDIMYGKGISREGSLIDVGVEQSIIRKAGAWYTYEGDQLGQGKEKAREFLRENPDVAAEIEKKILEKLGVGVSTSDAASGPALPPVDF